MTILTDFSEDAVNAATEANFLAFVDELEKFDGIELYQGDDMIRVVMPSVPHPIVNMITRTRLSGEIDSAIQAAMTVYTERNIPFLWQIEPSSTPDNLGEKLAEHGMQATGKNEVLLADLETITESTDTPDGYEIKQVLDEELLSAFGKVFATGFELPQMVLDVILPIMSNVNSDASITSYVGFLDGEPVSAGTTIYAAGVAGFYNGTVLESARGKGIGTANALHRVATAKERGYRIGFMISGGNAYNLYRRIGFKDYPAFEPYLWMPAQEE